MDAFHVAFGGHMGIDIAAVLLCGALYVAYADTALFATFLRVLTVAGAFHNFIIRRFEELGELRSLFEWLLRLVLWHKPPILLCFSAISPSLASGVVEAYCLPNLCRAV
jgi:hypothetical protein